MDILLLQDIPGVGKKNDLLIVGDGFALNYLLPKHAALVATPLVRRRYAEFIKRRAEEKEKEKSFAANAAAAVSGKTIILNRKATKTGKLYAAITEDAIVEALLDQHKAVVLAEDITIDEHIKTIGEHTVNVQMGGKDVSLTVKVTEEKA